MRDRLQQFIKKKGLSSNAFAEEINVQPSSVSHVLSGRNNPSYDFITKILLRFKELNADWLLTGRGEMFKSVYQANLFEKKDNRHSAEANQEIKKEPVSSLLQETKSDKPPLPRDLPISGEIEKIVIFYKNKTFQSYNPQ